MRPRIACVRLPRSISIRYNSTTTTPETLKESLLSREFHLEHDTFRSKPQSLLHASLQGFLPSPPAHHDNQKYIYPGSHLVYFPPAVPEENLLPDGTDLLHAPDPSYKYRLWAGGEVSFPTLESIVVQSDSTLQLDQKIVDVKTKAGKEPSVWVKISRTIASVPRYSRPLPVPLILENRWLVFFQSKPSVAFEKVTSPPMEPYYAHKMRATNALLFRFSALTFNAHAIHIDPEYTKNEYGLPGLLVHGPLTFVLMMEVLARGLDQHAREHGLNPALMIVRNVEYKNVMPVFVGEEVTICCSLREERKIQKDDINAEEDRNKQEEENIVQNDSSGTTETQDDQEGKEWQWEVWVEKLVNGQPSLCVKGTVTVIHWVSRNRFRSIHLDVPVRRIVNDRSPIRRILANNP